MARGALTLNANKTAPWMVNLIGAIWWVEPTVCPAPLVQLFEKATVAYGDTVIEYAMDIVDTYEAKLRADMSKLLTDWGVPDGEYTTWTMDVVRLAAITLDELWYNSQAAGSPEGFAIFNNMALQTMENALNNYIMGKVYMEFGSHVGTATLNEVTVTLADIPAPATTTDYEAMVRLKTQRVANTIKKLTTDLTLKNLRTSRDNGFYGNVNPEDLITVWNIDALNSLNIDLSMIRNPEYLSFGSTAEITDNFVTTINTEQSTGDGATIVSREEQTIGTGDSAVKLKAGEIVPSGTVIPAGKSATIDPTTIAFVTTRGAFPLIYGFRNSKVFNNIIADVDTYCIKVGHNTLKFSRNHPFVRVKMGAQPVQPQPEP